LSSAKRKVKSGVNQQGKSRLSAVRDFLAGRSGEPKAEESDKATRDVVAAELLATMSGRTNAQTTTEYPPGTTETEKMTQADSEATTETSGPDAAEKKRARQFFLDQGYFEDTVESLRPGNSSAERAAAARALGTLGSERATPHLIAAMFDDDAEVRIAAEDALRLIGDPTVAGVASQTVAPAESPAVVEPSAPAASAIEPGESALQVEPVPVVEAESTATIEPAAQAEVIADSVVAKQPEVSAAPVTVPEPADVSALPVTAEVPAPDHLQLEEATIKEELEAVEEQIQGVVAAVNRAQNEIRWRAEREGQLRADAAARRLEEEELRKRADEEARERRLQEHQALTLEQEARIKAEFEVQRHAEAEKNLRLKHAEVRLQLTDLARRRTELEIAHEQARETAERAEALRLRDAATVEHETEVENLRDEEATLKRKAEELRQQQEQLRLDIEHLGEATEQVSRQRAEVEAAREKAATESQEFAQAQARMRETERASARAEQERAELEAEINRQLETHRRGLEETRQRQEQERERLEEEVRLQAAKEKAHHEELQAMKARADADSNTLAETEREILSEIDSLRINDLDTRRRIEDAEAKRRATEEAYRLIAEKVQRVEAEAHARSKEEEQILAKLETERRRVAVEAQSRAEQEKRIRDEIDMFRRLEAEERPRIEAATLQLADVEKRVQEQKEHLRELAEARLVAEEELRTPEHEGAPFRSRSDEAIVPEPVSALPEIGPAPQRVAELTRVVDDADMPEDIPPSASPVSPTITTYLQSVDPYKRAAAVAELARSNMPGAFDRIAESFDDHSAHVRNSAARALRRLEPARTVDLFNRALEGASPERRRNIGAAIAGSGLAAEAVNNLASDRKEETYSALSILFVMAKTGEVEPLVMALEAHRGDEIGKAVTKLLTLSGHQHLAAADRQNASTGSDDPESGG
jgi:HEAT repeat protein